MISQPQRVETTGFPLTDQQLRPRLPLQPCLQPPTGGQWPEPQHGAAWRQLQAIKLELPAIQLPKTVGGDGGQWIRQQQPTTAGQPLPQSLLIRRQGWSQPTPGAGHHHARLVGIELRGCPQR